MKKVTIRIFLSVFVLWFFSLWLNVVYGQGSLGSTQCDNVWNFSSNSSNWRTYTNNNNVASWYINNSRAIWLAVAWNEYDSWVCRNNYINGTNVEKTQWKVDLCNNNLPALQSHQTSLFNKYIEIKGSNYSQPQFNNTTDVLNLQNLMSQAQCHGHNKDCKLWVYTISNFLFCNVCKSINSDWLEPTSLEPITCQTWYVLTDNSLCCQPVSAQGPIIKIDEDPNKSWYDNNPLAVVVDYSINNPNWSMTRLDSSKITINGWISSDFNDNLEAKTITFQLTPDDSNTITINVGDGAGELEWVECLWTSKTLNRTAPCQEKKDWKQCTNFGSFGLEVWATDLSSLEGQNCELNWTSLSFCAWCNIIPEEGKTCEQRWSWRYDEGNGCCINCGWNKKLSNGKCVCTATTLCKTWTTFSDKTCRCECDPTQRCCGILLNTVVPFIGDCIEMTTQNSISDPSDPNKSRVNQLNAFPFLMMWLSKILVTIILIFSFLIIIAAWLMMTTGVYKEQNYKTWVDRITKVIVWLILLWASGLILRLINPSFFGW